MAQNILVIICVVLLISSSQAFGQDNKFTQETYTQFRSAHSLKIKGKKYSVKTTWSEKLTSSEMEPFYKIKHIEDFDPSGIRRIKYTKSSEAGVYFEEVIITDKNIYEKIGDQPWKSKERNTLPNEKSASEPQAKYSFGKIDEQTFEGTLMDVHQFTIKVKKTIKLFVKAHDGRPGRSSDYTYTHPYFRKMWIDKSGFIRKIEHVSGFEKDAKILKTELYDYTGDFTIQIPEIAQMMTIK